jgi:hypothetical protein
MSGSTVMVNPLEVYNPLLVFIFEPCLFLAMDFRILRKA